LREETFGGGTQSQNEVEKLLQKAAQKLGMQNYDLSPYMKKFQNDWYDDLNSLQGKSVDTLKDYMPRRLAEIVHEMLQRREKDDTTKTDCSYDE
jgi:hypothetical protein